MNLRACLVILAALPCVLQRCVAAQGIPCSYSVTVLPEVDCGVFSGPGNPVGLNNLGHVLLTAACGDYDRTYLWTGGDTLTQLPVPPGALSFTATDLNDVGQVVGYAVINANSVRRGYIHDLNTGEWTELPPLNPPQGWSAVSAITNSAVVCGFRSIGSKEDPVNPFQAFVWSPAQGFTDLGVMTGPNSGARDIAENGTVVGWTGGDFFTSGSSAFILRNGYLTVLLHIPNGVSSAAAAIGADGTVAIHGSTQAFPPIPRGFAYIKNTYVDLGILPPFEIVLVADVANDGIITGTLRRLNPSLNHGFVWHRGVMRDLNDLVVSSGPILVRSAGSINQSGQILGTAGLPIEDATIVLTPVARPGDVHPDCFVNIDDLLTVIQWWGPGSSPGDANGDGVVDLIDLMLVIDNWTFN